MRTTINLDDELIKELMHVSGVKRRSLPHNPKLIKRGHLAILKRGQMRILLRALPLAHRVADDRAGMAATTT